MFTGIPFLTLTVVRRMVIYTCPFVLTNYPVTWIYSCYEKWQLQVCKNNCILCASYFVSKVILMHLLWFNSAFSLCLSVLNYGITIEFKTISECMKVLKYLRKPFELHEVFFKLIDVHLLRSIFHQHFYINDFFKIEFTCILIHRQIC